MDKKDLQILEILAQNCRVPYVTIGQALNLSKDAVAYRIKKLEKDNLIKQYVLFVDARKLGFARYHILIKFKEGVKDKKSLYQKIAKHKFVMWINSFIGRYDAQIIVDAKDSFHLNQIREEIFAKTGNKVKEYIILTHLSDLEFTQLIPVLNLKTKFKKKLDHSFSSILTTRKFPVGPEFERYFPNKVEVNILKLLSENPRESLINISRKLKVDRATVKKRIVNLIRKGVILNFGGIPNHSKQGFVTYYLLVRVKQDTSLDILQKPFTKLRNIFYAGKMVGDYDLILYLNARDPQELNSSIELFKSEIETYILHYDLLVQDDVHYWRQFTNGIYDELGKV